MKRLRCRVAWCATLVAAAGGVAAASGPPAVAAHARRSFSRGLDVLPFPGTPDAAPRTNIDFPAVRPSQIASLVVNGSRSGRHTGRLSAQPGRNGSAFSPARPFAPGERVSVTATLRSAAADTASGANGARLRFAFSVARPAFLPTHAGSGISGANTRGARMVQKSSGSPPTHSFVTEPGFKAPTVTATHDPDTSSGDIFLDAKNSGQNAALLLDPQGGLLWYHPSASQGAGPSIINVERQTYDGQHVLTYWQGQIVNPPGVGEGEDLILNHSYKTIHTVTAGDGYTKQGTDLHEFTLGQEGSEETAFVPIWSPVKANLTSVGGPSNGTVIDWIIQEIDVSTNKVIWEWQSLGHVPISDSYSRYTSGQPYDYFHLNSIQQLSNGKILISARNTWAVYEINKSKGKIDWELGGKHSTFAMGSGTHFYWQHHATLHSGGLLTVFDDGAAPAEEKQSRALKIHLNMKKDKATLVQQFVHKPSTQTTAEGSVQLLSNHNVFVGWGYSGSFSEYSPSGSQIFNGSYHSPIQSYRAFRAKWVGTPLQPPAIAVRSSSTAGSDNVYTSWNGATQVASWQLLAGTSPTTLKRVKQVPRSGFETKIKAASASYFEVQALDAQGHVLPNGTSAVVAGP